ncbi:tripartite tricarboxylate transporter permease [Caldinitratiruptor microaerophilus]|uniref:DUF112 domain-containing protein n=1 Tax=Caldinitratiruptor microaerophilus TaxID=671077 RepID=A0AA35CNT2_9FIRM|nr:tripartite tricarboxylate transporter permease [Caldinitratiruptor microaerophilus]BDG61002.1 hypothetical protein caldi_20920 [Caldinitratiruptor microaerophilus]
MSTWDYLLRGFAVALEPNHLLFAVIGVVAGEVIGALPGIGSVSGVALLLPLTFGMDPTAAIIMLSGIYYGVMYGSTISAVLIDIPGDSAAIMTGLDGHMLAKQGRAGQALFVAAVGSFVAGTFAIIMLSFFAPPLARFGLRFGPPEMAMLMLLALTSLGWLTGESPVKGLISGVIGLLLALVGMDSVNGNARFNFGSIELLDGIPLLPVVIGLFGITQVLVWLERQERWSTQWTGLSIRNVLPSAAEWASSVWAIVRGTVVGFFVGLLPGAGATTSSFLAYTVERQVSRNPAKFGRGAIEGVAAPESANNAAAIAAYVPLLSLGIPGSGTTAVLMGGLMMWGLRPGPLLFRDNPDFVWGLIASFYIANLMLLAINTLAIPAVVKVLALPAPILMVLVAVLSLVGGYAIDNSLFDVGVVLVAGILGYFLTKLRVPVAPLILALVLGPDLETALRRSFLLSRGSPAIFVTRPIALVLLLLTVVSLLAPVVAGMLRSRRVVVAEARGTRYGT